MLKFLGFLVWWGSAIASLGLCTVYMTNVNGTIGQLVLYGLLFLLSGIGRRIFHIKKAEDEKWLNVILHRIHCKRFYVSIFFYSAVMTVVYFAHEFFHKDNLLYILYGFIAIIVGMGINNIMRKTCSHCGFGAKYDGVSYDDEVTYESSSSSTKAFRWSTDFYHCPRCGHQSSIRSKHKIGQVNYH